MGVEGAIARFADKIHTVQWVNISVPRLTVANLAVLEIGIVILYMNAELGSKNRGKFEPDIL